MVCRVILLEHLESYAPPTPESEPRFEWLKNLVISEGAESSQHNRRMKRFSGGGESIQGAKGNSESGLRQPRAVRSILAVFIIGWKLVCGFCEGRTPSGVKQKCRSFNAVIQMWNLDQNLARKILSAL